jgi:SAM-dependent methyltransferase
MSQTVNFGLTADDYARHRAGFPEALFERVFGEGLIRPGAALLDLGTGTGALARGLAQRGCRVTGLDPSVEMLRQARRLDRRAQVSADHLVALAEHTGLPRAAFDVVTAGQCWHWFDRPRAAAEVRRVLKPGGRVLLAHFDWLPLRGNVVEATEQLIAHHNPAWTFGGGTGLYPQWLTDLGQAGFAGIETFSFDVDVPYTPEAWRGRIRASAGVGASLSADAVARFDRELAELLGDRFPGSSLQIPHRVFAVTAVRPA